MKLFHFLLAFMVSFLPITAYGQITNSTSISNATTAVAPCTLHYCLPALGIGGLAADIKTIILTLIGAIATYNIVKAGMKMIVGSEEETLNKAKTSIAVNLVGLVLAFLSGRFVDAFFLGGAAFFINAPTVADIQAGASVAALEIQGLILWLAYILAALGILMIIVSGIKAMGSFGKDDAVTQFRNSVFGVITGLLLIVIGPSVKLALSLNTAAVAVLPGGTPSTGPIISKIVSITTILMEFLALVATAMILYAGVLMIVNTGNDEQYTKAKGLIVRAFIVLIVILLSFVAVSFVSGLVVP